MKTIYFIRHAKSSWDNIRLADHDRPLNERGKRDAPRMADVLSSRETDCDGIVTSTAKRARSTAKRFAKMYELDKDQIIKTKDLYHAYPEQITKVIHTLPADWNTVLIFGHNPGFTDMANELLGDFIDNVPTCGIIGAQLDVKDWKEWQPEKAVRHLYHYPKQF